MIRKNNRHFVTLLFAFVTCLYASTVLAATQSLEHVGFNPLPNNKVQMVLQFSKPVRSKPASFITKSPARIVLDFKSTTNQLKDTNQDIGLGVARSMSSVEANGRTRVVVSLDEPVKYSTRVDGNKLIVTIGTGKGVRQRVTTRTSFTSRIGMGHPGRHIISDIDFRKSQDGGAQLVIEVSDPNIGVDVRREGNRVIADFLDTRAPKRLQRRFDVTDFATSVSNIDIMRKGNNVQVSIQAHGDFTHYAYQVNRKFIIDVKEVTAAQKAKLEAARPRYTGKRISLNFQDIKVRAVLQLLADFTKMNIVVSDSVKGNMTLHLNKVPWDQALAIILKTRALAKRQMGTVMLIAPAAELAAQEKQELKAKMQAEELAPLRSELIQVKYGKAADFAKLLKEKGGSVLSDRGTVSFDVRTNTLWVQDTAFKLEEIRHLIQQLDIPVKQVLIEARIVIVTTDFERELGIRWGITKENHLSGTLEGANELAKGVAAADVPFRKRLNVDLAAAAINGTHPASIGIALANLGNGVMLDLELSALEAENKAKIISSPRLITADQQTALIESGEEIPYQEATSSGATAIAFKKAVLSLEVTPHITPDAKIIMRLQVNQDEALSLAPINGVPAISTKEIQTNVLVSNGETIVLGGIYKQTKADRVERVPFLGRIPLIGVFFQHRSTRNDREELLIFITPRIVENGYIT